VKWGDELIRNTVGNNKDERNSDLISISRFLRQRQPFCDRREGKYIVQERREDLGESQWFITAKPLLKIGFAILDRSLLNPHVWKAIQRKCCRTRRASQKMILLAATVTKGKRPSVETSMHNVINYAFVVLYIQRS